MIGLVNSFILAAALVPMPREIEMLSGVCRADAPVEIRHDASIPAEGYRLSISPGAIKIASSDAAGEFYARVTLEQLGGEDIPCCEITDAPRYRWRGCLIDEGRHFFGKATVKKMIDAMAYHKLNVLLPRGQSRTRRRPRVGHHRRHRQGRRRTHREDGRTRRLRLPLREKVSIRDRIRSRGRP